MKTANNTPKIFVLFLSLLLLSAKSVLSNELESPNFKMIGVSTGGGGEILTSPEYSVLSTIGRISADPRVYSTSYRLDQDPSARFRAAQPTVKCFEATTDGTTDCVSGPQELLDHGMVGICGPGGCYNRARFEIEEHQNPEDTLYMIQVSIDNFASDIKCLDGSTFKPKSLTNCNINDFRTQQYWENEDFNIKGLDSNTEYFLRITALHGDFTQSDFSIVASTTTGIGFLFFDIDIASDSGYSTESSPPYSIFFAGTNALLPSAATTTAPSLIWLDLITSATGGSAIIHSGKYGGLYSTTTTEIIPSDNEDLDSQGAEGFGLQNYYIDYQNSTYLGDIEATTNYTGSGNVVGKVSTSAIKMYEASGPINNGRMGMYVKARAGANRAAADDYIEKITMVAVARY
ncbi:MAG: hypothetical protein PHP96_00880 [Candidatus Dojkabacteria bacterium]|nr:hypothetical protein [Candidatus Dojkabacteria bacterium]